MRGKQAKKRIISPDVVYNSEIVSQLINYVMKHGKKKIARVAVYSALTDLAKETKSEVIDALQKALANVTPRLEVKSRRVGGAQYQVPLPVSPIRGRVLSLRWLVEAARSRKGKKFSVLLSEELLSAYNNTGTAVKKRENVEKMAEANRAFAQFR